MKKMLLLALAAAIINCGCATLYMSKKQTVTVSSTTKDGKIYVNDELQGKGSASFKTPKDGMKQVVIQTPGYKDNYFVLTNNNRQPGFWVCIGADAVFGLLIYSYPAMLMDFATMKGHAYNSDTRFQVNGKLATKTTADKYIEMDKLGLDLKDKDKDVNIYSVAITKSNSSQKIEKLMDEAEAKQKAREEKMNKRMKKKDLEKLKEEEDQRQYDDTKFSYNLYKTLKSTGFVDTVNRVFQDENNTILLEGKITKLNLYRVYYGNNVWSYYYKAKVGITWYIDNQYGECLDSVKLKNVSGDFVLNNYWYTYSSASRTTTTHSQSGEGHEQKQIEKMIGDAVNNSYLELFNSSTFKKYLPAGSISASTDPLLRLNRPQSTVNDKSDAAQASVIIKRDDKGHGSGFAITQDGYILTNYHVIAAKDDGNAPKLTVVTSSGEEITPKIVRINKSRDIALLKVEKKFDKAFALNKEKQFKNLQDVYTIGAPKSIELGQTVTTGIISSERNSNNNELIQLSMSVNFGNSGGPVFDNAGTLHGVIVKKMVGESTEGIAFAIPSYKIGDYINVTY
jgi:S1-C subfamily serine protease